MNCATVHRVLLRNICANLIDCWDALCQLPSDQPFLKMGRGNCTKEEVLQKLLDRCSKHFDPSGEEGSEQRHPAPPAGDGVVTQSDANLGERAEDGVPSRLITYRSSRNRSGDRQLTVAEAFKKRREDAADRLRVQTDTLQPVTEGVSNDGERCDQPESANTPNDSVVAADSTHQQLDEFLDRISRDGERRISPSATDVTEGMRLTEAFDGPPTEMNANAAAPALCATVDPGTSTKMADELHIAAEVLPNAVAEGEVGHVNGAAVQDLPASTADTHACGAVDCDQPCELGANCRSEMAATTAHDACATASGDVQMVDAAIHYGFENGQDGGPPLDEDRDGGVAPHTEAEFPEDRPTTADGAPSAGFEELLQEQLLNPTETGIEDLRTFIRNIATVEQGIADRIQAAVMVGPDIQGTDGSAGGWAGAMERNLQETAGVSSVFHSTSDKTAPSTSGTPSTSGEDEPHVVRDEPIVEFRDATEQLHEALGGPAVYVETETGFAEVGQGRTGVTGGVSDELLLRMAGVMRSLAAAAAEQNGRYSSYMRELGRIIDSLDRRIHRQQNLLRDRYRDLCAQLGKERQAMVDLRDEMKENFNVTKRVLADAATSAFGNQYDLVLRSMKDTVMESVDKALARAALEARLKVVLPSDYMESMRRQVQGGVAETLAQVQMTSDRNAEISGKLEAICAVVDAKLSAEQVSQLQMLGDVGSTLKQVRMASTMNALILESVKENLCEAARECGRQMHADLVDRLAEVRTVADRNEERLVKLKEEIFAAVMEKRADAEKSQRQMHAALGEKVTELQVATTANAEFIVKLKGEIFAAVVEQLTGERESQRKVLGVLKEDICAAVRETLINGRSALCQEGLASVTARGRRVHDVEASASVDTINIQHNQTSPDNAMSCADSGSASNDEATRERRGERSGSNGGVVFPHRSCGMPPRMTTAARVECLPAAIPGGMDVEVPLGGTKRAASRAAGAGTSPPAANVRGGTAADSKRQRLEVERPSKPTSKEDAAGDSKGGHNGEGHVGGRMTYGSVWCFLNEPSAYIQETNVHEHLSPQATVSRGLIDDLTSARGRADAVGETDIEGLREIGLQEAEDLMPVQADEYGKRWGIVRPFSGVPPLVFAAGISATLFALLAALTGVPVDLGIEDGALETARATIDDEAIAQRAATAATRGVSALLEVAAEAHDKNDWEHVMSSKIFRHFGECSDEDTQSICRTPKDCVGKTVAGSCLHVIYEWTKILDKWAYIVDCPPNTKIQFGVGRLGKVEIQEELEMALRSDLGDRVVENVYATSAIAAGTNSKVGLPNQVVGAMKDPLDQSKGFEPQSRVVAINQPGSRAGDGTARVGVAPEPNAMMIEIGKMVDAAVSAAVANAVNEGLLKRELLKVINSKLNATVEPAQATAREKAPPPPTAHAPSGHERQTKPHDASPELSMGAAEEVMTVWEFADSDGEVGTEVSDDSEGAAPILPESEMDGKRQPRPSTFTITPQAAKIPRAAGDTNKQGGGMLTFDGVMRYLADKMPGRNEEDDENPIGALQKVMETQQNPELPEISEEKDGRQVEVQDHSKIVPDQLGKKFGVNRPFRSSGFFVRQKDSPQPKFFSEQTVGGRKRHMGCYTKKRRRDFTIAVCWSVFFPDVDLACYGMDLTDIQKWKAELDFAKRIPTDVWSVMNELTLDRFDNFGNVMSFTKERVSKEVQWETALTSEIAFAATLQGSGAVPNRVNPLIFGAGLAASLSVLWLGSLGHPQDKLQEVALNAAKASVNDSEVATKAAEAASCIPAAVISFEDGVHDKHQWIPLLAEKIQSLLKDSQHDTALTMSRVASRVVVYWCQCSVATAGLRDNLKLFLNILPSKRGSKNKVLGAHGKSKTKE
ncbi:unnamed protein product [Closterium sp. Yama58-4]|nr:unnamed protein product [Closterium sp. Yama58-4]